MEQVSTGIKLHVSKGNIKVGSIPNFSLTPGITCSKEACKTCFCDGCYARKAYRQYPSTRVAWDENTELAKNNLPKMFAELDKYFTHAKPAFFRVHVAGDFVSREYAIMWRDIASKHPETAFLVFTKQWSMIDGIEFPANFSLVLSSWPGTTIPRSLTSIYPVAYLDDGTTSIPETAIRCPGHCEHCNACWGLAKKHIDVAFSKH